jgi:hypothetical protein
VVAGDRRIIDREQIVFEAADGDRVLAEFVRDLSAVGEGNLKLGHGAGD